MALLSDKQSYVVDKMSQLEFKESTDFSQTSNDSELERAEPENVSTYSQLAMSKNKVDMKLVNIYLL